MRRFTYEPAILGYNRSTFILKSILLEQGDTLPAFPKFGEIDTMNNMLNIVANGEEITITSRKETK